MNLPETRSINGTQNKKFRKLSKKKVKKQTPNKSNEIVKNVSWENTDNYSEHEEKKSFQSTPYPNAVKKLKIAANSTPISLSFDSCDSDDEISSTNGMTTHDKKRKRSKLVKTKKSGWTITTCTEVKPDKTNRPLKEKATEPIQKKSKKLKEYSYNSNKRIVNTRNGSYIFDDSYNTEKIANQILRNIFNDEVNELLDESSDSENPDELIPIKNDVYDYDRSSPIIVFESSSDESSDSNVNIAFNPPKIKLNKKSCQIIEPKITSLINNISKTNKKDDDLVDLKSEEIIEPAKKRAPQVLNILKKFQYFLSETHVIIKLKYPFNLYFNGKLSLIVLSGAIEVLGHVLDFNNKLESEIYSPRGQSFLCLETLKSKRNPNLFNVLQTYLSEEQASKIRETLKENDCLIAVRNLKNRMSEYLEKHVAQHLYPNELQINRRPLMKIENKLRCLFELETAPLRLYKKQQNWPKLVNSALSKSKENHSRTILCGGKSVGKSTLLRYMINNMLNQVDKVVCIDLDPGQSEFTISGSISVTIINSPIFGPNYTHLKTPEKSFFVGDVNVTNVLDRYIISVKELFNYCEQNISKELPWIINCMGFAKSIGTDLIVLIIQLAKPSIVVQLESLQRNRNYESHLTQEYVQNFKPSFPILIANHKVQYELEIFKSAAEEIGTGDWISEPRFLREMCILSYFSQMLEDKREITGVTPYGVKMSSIKLYNINYFKENISATLNGNLVALCEVNSKLIENQTPFSCLGFGIVRGIDKESGELYLLTPITENKLDKVNSLIRGDIALPPSIFMTTGHQGLVPYIQLGTLQGANEIPKRSFISWKMLLKKK